MNLGVLHFLIKFKAASLLKKEFFFTKINNALLKFLCIFYKYHYIQSFKINKKRGVCLIKLKFYSSLNFLKNLKIISTSSKVCYITYLSLSKILSKNFFLLISTDLGVLTLSNCKKQKSGGKILLSC